MGKVGRNEPCPCGSGKKYKKCCIEKETLKGSGEFDAMIQRGTELTYLDMDIAACDIWFPVWENLKLRISPESKSIEELDRKYSGTESIYNWCQDFEISLGNAGLNDRRYFEKRIKFCREFVNFLPDSDKLIIENMRRAEAETYFSLGKPDEGEAAFQSLAGDFPDSAWVYIGWGDMYFLYRNACLPPDYEKAGQFYNMALTKKLTENDRESVLGRLRELEIEKQRQGETVNGKK